MSADRDDWETISALLSDVESHKTICGSTIITGTITNRDGDRFLIQVEQVA